MDTNGTHMMLEIRYIHLKISTTKRTIFAYGLSKFSNFSPAALNEEKTGFLLFKI